MIHVVGGRRCRHEVRSTVSLISPAVSLSTIEVLYSFPQYNFLTIGPVPIEEVRASQPQGKSQQNS
ncbi:hypothetical protein J6590_101837 [Homalodisca vitripennis]|nr:hypothetical protein J6590_101837 [Homalodisca vitripennis]